MDFNEEETGSLIERASQLHKDSLGNAEHHLNLSEIEVIAEELGIPPRFLVEAALEKRQKDAAGHFSLTGAPFNVQDVTVVDGKVTEEDWEEVLAELRDYSGKDGHIKSGGSLRRWSHAVGEGESGFNFEELSVTLKSLEDRTSIRIKKEYKGAVAMYFAAFGFTSFITLMVAHSLPEVSKISELIYAGLGGVLSLGGVRAMISISARRYKEDISELATRIKSVVGSTTHSSTSATGSQDNEQVELERHPSLERVHSSESVHPDEAERAVTPSIMADIHDSPSSSEFRAEKGRPRTKE